MRIEKALKSAKLTNSQKNYFFAKNYCNFETNVVKYRSIWMKTERTLSGAVFKHTMP